MRALPPRARQEQPGERAEQRRERPARRLRRAVAVAQPEPDHAGRRVASRPASRRREHVVEEAVLDVTSGFRSSTQSLGGAAVVPRPRRLLGSVGAVTPRFTPRAKPRLRLNRRTVTPGSFRACGRPGETGSGYRPRRSAAPVRIAIERRKLADEPGGVPPLAEVDDDDAEGGGGRRGTAAGDGGEERLRGVRLGQRGVRPSSVGGGVPPGGTARAMPDSFRSPGQCRSRLHPRVGGILVTYGKACNRNLRALGERGGGFSNWGSHFGRIPSRCIVSYLKTAYTRFSYPGFRRIAEAGPTSPPPLAEHRSRWPFAGCLDLSRFVLHDPTHPVA